MITDLYKAGINLNYLRELDACVWCNIQNVKAVFDAAIKVVLQPPKTRKRRKKTRPCVVLWLVFLFFCFWCCDNLQPSQVSMIRLLSLNMCTCSSFNVVLLHVLNVSPGYKQCVFNIKNEWINIYQIWLKWVNCLVLNLVLVVRTIHSHSMCYNHFTKSFCTKSYNYQQDEDVMKLSNLTARDLFLFFLGRLVYPPIGSIWQIQILAFLPK